MDLDGQRLAVVELALLDPLEERLAGELGMHAREVGVGALGRALDEGVGALEGPADGHARVEELDRRCGGGGTRRAGRRYGAQCGKA